MEYDDAALGATSEANIKPAGLASQSSPEFFSAGQNLLIDVFIPTIYMAFQAFTANCLTRTYILARICIRRYLFECWLEVGPYPGIARERSG